ncbi:putative surface protein with fasciclin (FAS1) repeats [Nonlabens dokdonensis]|uniref:Secreted and surface protein containing fasciclin-like repeats n=2 Tax=Nonlabens dokdonensis TaxID=328515 RepID=L7WAG9_NONDD|nr:fasciclin domain-containing protein [Nonlabens dokdonensis]AGC76831.1 secreted and surface protein containing fasciclin-like repeats [Nonlabens dokdonensis DSW-6]PZX44472.1 putative surface protein with fasciclin (FAS1) repeats [Nonlabens dokdonensis]
MKKSKLMGFALAAVVFFTGSIAQAQTNIVEGAVASDAHTTLVAAVKAADLVETLSGEGPFTVFAPTNAAFDKLPEGTVANLLKPENKKTLQTVLTYHVIAGKFNAKDVIALIKKNNGYATVKTVAGAELTLYLKDSKVMVKDGNGNSATVTAADLDQTNGVIHVVDSVLLPKM